MKKHTMENYIPMQGRRKDQEQYSIIIVHRIIAVIIGFIIGALLVSFAENIYSWSCTI